MLMPTLSVTAIGVLAGLVAIGLRRRPASALLRGLLGAWLGFLAGAVVGGAADVLAGTGGLLALVGHLGAVAGAAAAVTRARPAVPADATRR